MIGAIARWRDDLLGRGRAAITVPVLDGALRPNRTIDQAEVVHTSDDLADLASDGMSVYAACGSEVLCLQGPASEISPVSVSFARAAGRVLAIAAHPKAGVAMAVEGHGLHVVSGEHAGRHWNLGESGSAGITALSWADEDTLLVCEGSVRNPAAAWKEDLMTLGHSGRVFRWSCRDGRTTPVASGMQWCHGAAVIEGECWIAESWAHRLVRAGGGHLAPVLDGLPAYPSRLSPSAAGGAWLTCFAVRTQLVEFVLREPEFRRRMLSEIHPDHWIAPSMKAGRSFLEPMQAAHLKSMGIVKPWAPPRSYGLVLRLDTQGHVRSSLHSRYDGEHHGIVAAVECGDSIYLLSKGSGTVLRLPIRAIDEVAAA